MNACEPKTPDDTIREGKGKRQMHDMIVRNSTNPMGDSGEGIKEIYRGKGEPGKTSKDDEVMT